MSDDMKGKPFLMGYCVKLGGSLRGISTKKEWSQQENGGHHVIPVAFASRVFLAPAYFRSFLPPRTPFKPPRKLPSLAPMHVGRIFFVVYAKSCTINAVYTSGKTWTSWHFWESMGERHTPCSGLGPSISNTWGWSYHCYKQFRISPCIVLPPLVRGNYLESFWQDMMR